MVHNSKHRKGEGGQEKWQGQEVNEETLVAEPRLQDTTALPGRRPRQESRSSTNRACSEGTVEREDQETRVRILPLATGWR